MVPRPLHLPGSSRWPIPIRRPSVNPRRLRRLPIPSSHRRCNSRPITASPLPATRFLPHRNRSPGYDYDPYKAREDEGGSSQWLVLGCFVFFVLAFVCFGFIGLLLIDTLNLWCDTPVIKQIVAAFGYC